MPKVKGGARSGSAKHTLSYISKECALDERGTYNLLSDAENSKAITKEFETNNSDRGTRTFYHDHVSFHPKDQKKCTPELMRDFAEKYIDKTYPKQQVFWGVHRDKEHVHAHFCISATNLDGKKLHLNNKGLGARDKFVQEYAKDRGLHYLEELKLKMERNKDQSKELKKNRGEFKSQKEEIKHKIQYAIDNPDVLTKAQFRQELEKQNLKITTRETGIIVNDRKYRFNKLGYDNDLYRNETFNGYRSERTKTVIEDREKEAKLKKVQEQYKEIIDKPRSNNLDKSNLDKYKGRDLER